MPAPAVEAPILSHLCPIPAEECDDRDAAQLPLPGRTVIEQEPERASVILDCAEPALRMPPADDDEALKSLSVHAYPTLVLIDRTGKVFSATWPSESCKR